MAPVLPEMRSGLLYMAGSISILPADRRLFRAARGLSAAPSFIILAVGIVAIGLVVLAPCHPGDGAVLLGCSCLRLPALDAWLRSLPRPVRADDGLSVACEYAYLVQQLLNCVQLLLLLPAVQQQNCTLVVSLSGSNAPQASGPEVKASKSFKLSQWS